MKYVIDIDTEQVYNDLLCLGCKMYKSSVERLTFDLSIVAECKLSRICLTVEAQNEDYSIDEAENIKKLLKNCPLVPMED